MDERNNTTYPLESYKFIILDVSQAPKEFAPRTKYPLDEYEIWSGSFLCTGMEGIPAEPTFHGKEFGRNFQDACFRYFLKKEIKLREEADIINGYYDTKRFDYDPYKNTYWACKLFSSKEEAYEDYNKNWK